MGDENDQEIPMRHGRLAATIAILLVAAAIAAIGGAMGRLTVVLVATVVPVSAALTLRFLAGPPRGRRNTKEVARP
jgi:hypothetical protein